MALLNPFASKETFIAQVKNVGAVLKESLNPFSSAKPIADVKNPLVKSALEFVSANPLETALIAATGASSAARSAIVSTVSKLSTTTKVVGGAIGLATVPAIVASPTLASKTIQGASKLTPTALVRASTQAGQLVENPTLTSAGDFLKNNAVILGAGALALTAVAGRTGVQTLANVSNVIATERNTKAITSAVDQSKVTVQPLANNAPTVTIPSGNSGTIPPTNPVPTQPVAAPLATKGSITSSTTRKKRTKRSPCCQSPKSIKRAKIKLSLDVTDKLCSR